MRIPAMRFPFIATLAVAFHSLALAAEPQSVSLDFRINIADQREVHLAATVPAGTSHRLQVEGDLSLDVRTTPMASGGQWVETVLVNTAGGANRRLMIADWPARQNELARVQWVSLSVCGERFISARDVAPGRCAELPPLAKPDRLYGRCGLGGNLCNGAYEGMPATITSYERLAPATEPGEPVKLSGRVLDAAGRPRGGIIIYAYQTDRNGIYPPVLPLRSNASNMHGRLRAWARSDAQGRYSFDTIRPGSYGGNPEHVHMHVIEPSCATYVIDDLMFTGDPNLERLTSQQRSDMMPGLGGSGLSTLRRKGEGWEVVRDIRLGAKIPDYEACSVHR